MKITAREPNSHLVSLVVYASMETYQYSMNDTRTLHCNVHYM